MTDLIKPVQPSINKSAANSSTASQRTVQELFARLFITAHVSGGQSPDAQKLIREIEAVSPDLGQSARDFCDSAIRNSVNQQTTLNPSKQPWAAIFSIFALPIGLFVLFIFGPELADALYRIPLPRVTGTWGVCLIATIVGGLVATAYSFWRNNWTLILPVFSERQHQLAVSSLGFVRNFGFGVFFSYAATWLAIDGSRTNATGENLLTWSILINAAVAGFVGSLMASDGFEKRLLWTALSASAEASTVPEIATLLKAAKTPFDAAVIATGLSMDAGARPSRLAAHSEFSVTYDDEIPDESVVSFLSYIDQRAKVVGGAGISFPPKQNQAG